ncbi:hypothetical protein LVY65_11725 [Sphingomonas sp. G124]|uniref:Peptidase M10 metallopeptidase domain-containing protein n=1 Tax=Sphingomonas cremea TaxID=2904799 RepID=A0A9X1QNH0_9SPHN|nr:hypothetical protein [Sphingomonas cremea]MCF2515729.1 hypothetical protein [Sphingomonas cremea]
MRKMFVRAALLSCAALVTGPAIANHSWGGYHWAGDGSNLTLKVNTAITSQWNTSVSDSISDWNQSTELVLNSASSSASAKRCSPISGQILVCNASYGQRGWLGIASIWLTNGHISQATTKLNDSYHNYAPYNSPAWRALVACQEIGHDFGLDHQDETFDNVNLGTCMDYTNAPDGGLVGGFNYGPSNRHPNTHDYDELKAIYNHDDGFTTAKSATNFGIRQVGQAPPQSAAGSGDSPAEWGRAIHNDSQGRPDVFLKDLGAGKKVITHVFWAIGKGPNNG